MKLTLTPAEVRNLEEFVLDVLEIIKYDDTGVTDDIAESALVAAEILGVLPDNNNNDEDED